MDITYKSFIQFIYDEDVKVTDKYKFIAKQLIDEDITIDWNDKDVQFINALYITWMRHIIDTQEK